MTPPSLCCLALDQLLAERPPRFQVEGAYRELFRVDEAGETVGHDVWCPACRRPLPRSVRDEYYDRLEWNGGSPDDLSDAWIREEVARDPFIFERLPTTGTVLAIAGTDAIGLVLAVSDGGGRCLLAVWTDPAVDEEHVVESEPSLLTLCSTWPMRRGDWPARGWRVHTAGQLLRRSVIEMTSVPPGPDGLPRRYWIGPELQRGTQLEAAEAQRPELLMVDDSDCSPVEFYVQMLGSDPPPDEEGSDRKQRHPDFRG